MTEKSTEIQSLIELLQQEANNEKEDSDEESNTKQQKLEKIKELFISDGSVQPECHGIEEMIASAQTMRYSAEDSEMRPH